VKENKKKKILNIKRQAIKIKKKMSTDLHSDEGE